MRLGRISNLERILGCPGSRFLPADPVSEQARAAAEHGTRMHKVMAGEATPLDLLGEDDADLDVLRNRFVGWDIEVPVAYNPALRVGHLFTDDATLETFIASDTGDWLTGHVDAMHVDLEAANLVRVCDLKTSQHPVSLDDPQLMGYAVAISAAIFAQCKREGKIVTPFEVELSVLHWPKHGFVRQFYLEKLGRPYNETKQRYPLQEIKDFATKISAALSKPRALSVASHCVYCPSTSYCPALKPGKGRIYGEEQS